MAIVSCPKITISDDAETIVKSLEVIAAVSSGAEWFYSTNQVTWIKIENTLLLTENGVYYFKAENPLNGLESSSYTTLEVNNIDNVPPELKIAGDTSTLTNQNVILTATSNEGTVEYFDGSEMVVGNTSTVTENGTYQFRVPDAAGNITEQSVIVNKSITELSHVDVFMSTKAWGDNVIFSGNSASWGGAIRNQSGTIIIGDTATFANNTASDGGAIDNGGVFTIGNEATFSGNKADNGSGGAIFNSKGGDYADIGNNAKFESNSASANGGAICNYINLTIRDNAVFSGNIAGNQGGAISNSRYSTVIIGKNSSFTSNQASLGGAIYSEGNVSIGDTATFANNSVSFSVGGAIYNKHGSFEIGDNTTFANNSVSSSTGGAIYNNREFIIGSGVVFSGNTAENGSGGAIGNTGTLVIGNNAVFKNNSASNSGGAVYNDGTITFGSAFFVTASDTIYNNGIIIVNENVSFAAVVTLNAESSLQNNGNIDLNITKRTSDSEALISDWSRISGDGTLSITIAADQADGTYKLAQNSAGFNGTISIGSDTTKYGSLTVNEDKLLYNDTIYSLNNTNGNLTLTIQNVPISDLHGNNNGVVWKSVPEVSSCTVAYSQNNFANSLQLVPETDAVDTYGMPAGTYQWKVSDGETWYNGNTITAAAASNAQTLISDHDGDMDLFFGKANGTWKAGYAAEHHGVLNGWSGTGEQVELLGKNKIADVFSGSDDANILVMTDDTNGDALFVDDVYTSFGKDAARIAQIDEIRAGAGDDIVDMTSQRFAYIGDGITIYGGLGNDTIWSNNGSNTLFGDAGNDRIVGGANNDVIVGGIGNDRMHGGGGDDIFTFGNNWGNDTIEQLDGGEITLWFESGEMSNWNADTLTYSDGTNSVKVSGISNDNITLIFGDDGSLRYDELATIGCFDAAASEKIFEDKNKGMLA